MTKAARTKQLIIEQAAPIFNTKGIAATAMSDIMEATGLAKGSLYVHFENKEELCNAVVDYTMHCLSEKVKQQLDRQKTAKGKLFAYVDFLSNTKQPPIPGGCPMLNFGMEADDTNPVIKKKVNKNITLAVATLTSILKEGIASGEFRQPFNAEEFATKMFALLEGGIMMSRMEENSKTMTLIVAILKKEIELLG